MEHSTESSDALGSQLAALSETSQGTILRALLETSAQGILLTDVRGAISVASPSAAKLFGYSPQDLQSGGLRRLLPELDLRHADDPRETEHRAIRADGSPFWARVVVCTVVLDGEPYLLITLDDLSETRQALAELRRSEAKYRIIVESAPVCIHEIDLDGQLLSINQTGLTMIESTREEVCGVHYLNFVDAESRARVGDLMQAAMAGKSSKFEFTLASNETLAFSSCFVPIRGDDGTIVRLMGITEDISARHEAEQQRLRVEQQMLQTQKLESLGLLAGGIAHDFNNLLMGVLGNTSMAREDTRDANVLSYLADIETTALRAAELCKQLLAYAGRGKFELRVLNLSALVADMATILAVTTAAGVALIYDLSDDLPAIEADPTQIRQVVMNLIINASDAIGEGQGDVVVTTSAVDLSEDQVDVQSPGRFVRLTVRDTGHGISPEDQALIFDPFFTTKSTGRGLGLAAVLGIIRAHKGSIRCTSTPGEGTFFEVLLPAKDAAVQPEALSPGSDPTRASQGLVLIVDDEPSVCSVAERMLRRAGFAVVSVDNGADALEIFAERGEEITLVLLDLVMPQLDGRQTFAAIRRMRATVPIILSSGYNEDDVHQLTTSEPAVVFLQKPYRAQELIIKVHELLGRPPAGGDSQRA